MLHSEWFRVFAQEFKMFSFLFTLTLFVLSSGAPNMDRFSNFYSQPENLRLIAMASDAHPRSHHHHHHHQPHPHPRQHEQPADDEPRFSIGLGTLAPSYSQKFGLDGSTRLDFNHRKDGFSYSLTNHHHPESGPGEQPEQQARTSYGYEPSNAPKNQRSPHINIYHDQHIRERFVPQDAETRNFFSAIGPRQAYGGEGGPSAKDLIPNAERYRELVDTLAPKGRDEDGGGYGGGGYEGGEGYEEGPVMTGRGGYRYFGSGEGQGYKPYSTPSQGAPPPPSYTARANPNYQAPYHQQPPPPESQWSGGDGSEGFGSGLGGFSEGGGFDMGGPFSEDGGFSSGAFGDDEVSMSPFSSAASNGINVGPPKSFEFGSTISSSPIGRSENNNNAVYLADLSQLGLGGEQVITDQATLKTILGLS